MTATGLSRRVRVTAPANISRHQLKILSNQISASVAGPAASGHGGRVGAVVEACVEAFVSSRGQVDMAAEQVAPLVHDLGARAARLQPDPGPLDRSFRLASVAVQRGLPLVMGERVSPLALRPLREGLVAYMAQLHRIARTGFNHTSQLMALTDAEKVQALCAIVFKGAPADDFEPLCQMVGADPEQAFVPLATVRTELPPAICDRSEVLVDSSLTQALVPADWSHCELERLLHGQAIVGPRTPLAEARRSVVLARDAAAMLRDGSARDSRILVPATDLLGKLLLRGNPLISELLVDKHLRPFEALSANRRFTLAETLLLVLERGLPLNQIARELDTAAQTVHNRMKALRELLGDKLDDPDLRLELIVAVRAGLDRWQSQSS